MQTENIIIPRVLIGAPKSGSGKTLITCALLGALKKRNIDVMAFKCGPDYIDPMFHRTVQNIPAENLDTFFLGEEKTKELFIDCMMNQSDMAVMEGVMGLFDGLGGVREEGSAYHLAKITRTPVILVVDVHGMGRSMIPLIRGFVEYDRDNLIKGIILNRISGKFFETMRTMIEEEISVPVLGYFPNNKELTFESRHLGLKMPEEMKDINRKLETASNQLEQCVDMDKLIEIARDAECLSCDSKIYVNYKRREHLTLAVARDEAFCFYYEANLREFEKRGVQIKYFSPLNDSKLPNGISGILLGGGYPELYAKRLSLNEGMRKSIKSKIEQGMPSLAECGGFMYLHKELMTKEGDIFEMAGLIDAKVSYTGRLVRFGYVEIEEKSDIFLHNKSIKGHEFHYFDSEDNGSDCIATKPVSGQWSECIHESDNHLWGFPHLYYPSNPEIIDKFIDAMDRYYSNMVKNQEN
jgi:cobyrinic acid a,c-diamide synthase